MKDFLKEYSKIIGLLVLTFVIILLLSPTSMIFARSITVIDTELSHTSGNDISVRTKMDFGDNEHIRAFPTKIGEWRGIDYNSTTVEERLGADVVLMRAYFHPKLYQPVFFLILQSDNRSSFHPPTVCYPALGYEVEEESEEKINIKNVSWAEAPFMSFVRDNMEDTEGIFNGEMNVRRLVVKKESEGKIKERRVVLYFYVKDNPFTSDNFTMIRVSALAPETGSYMGTLNNCKDFISEVPPHMFEFRDLGDIIAVELIKQGVFGWVFLFMLILLPFLIMFYPKKWV